MNVDLNGRVALVTGAARGIGQAIGDAFAANGARVAYTDVDLEAAKLAAAQAAGGRGAALAMDVTDPAQIDAAIAWILAEWGCLDILVNNAGVNTLKHRVTIDAFPRQEWDWIRSVDLDGLFLVSQAAARVMRTQGSGRIINIASIAGLVPLRLQCAFVAAKAAVINLTKAMALELGPHGILVNGIAPGSILTDGTRKLFYGEDGQFKDSVQQMLAHVPLGRPGVPEEVAHGALFLAAPESSYINGHILTIDGGWTAGYAREF
jgi:NAD(P)-dependent dehydrogenase (short-subunit alcohol dehydrogenase family)